MRRLFFALLLLLAALPGALAADDPQLTRIAAMKTPELEAFVATVGLAISKDSLQLRSVAVSGNCLELTRMANAFALGYGYLQAVQVATAKRPDQAAQLVRARAIQTRVVGFAARVRVEDWLEQRCRGYTPPAAQAADPRYATPAKVRDAEYTQALIDARITADTNLAIARAASTSGRCLELMASAQNIRLLLPYIDTLLNNTADRPQVFGPRASRRALDVSRRQLALVRDRLLAAYVQKCPEGQQQPSESVQ